jgi:HAD superfamily hydrolase (TIGR01509 family)
MKGIIFDFNGTMVFDGHLHEKAWIDMIKRHNRRVSSPEIIDFIHGRTNDKIIKHFIGDVTAEEQAQLAEEKELEYQRLVQEEQISYVQGTESLLDELVEKEIPFTIATASPAINVDFYFDYFDLSRWFDRAAIIFDDGTFPGKPDPAIYIKAAESLKLAPEDCVVVEDAEAGIRSANRANIGKVIAMVNSDEQKAKHEASALKIEAIVWDFEHFTKRFL